MDKLDNHIVAIESDAGVFAPQGLDLAAIKMPVK